MVVAWSSAGRMPADGNGRSKTCAAGEWSISAGQEDMMAQKNRLEEKDKGVKYREKAVGSGGGVA